MVAASNQVLFYSQKMVSEYDGTKHLEWKKYHVIETGGFIHF